MDVVNSRTEANHFQIIPGITFADAMLNLLA
jgi:hypothetical protein